jgi:hypothetical protein
MGPNKICSFEIPSVSKCTITCIYRRVPCVDIVYNAEIASEQHLTVQDVIPTLQGRHLSCGDQRKLGAYPCRDDELKLQVILRRAAIHRIRFVRG